MEIQKAVIYIIVVTIFIAILLFYANSKLKKYDPETEPKGIVLLCIMAYNFVNGSVTKDTNAEVGKVLGPYMLSVMIYIFLANIAGLFGLESPTGNYSVTLALALVTCVMIEVYAFKYNGVKGYMKNLADPNPVMIVMNVISKIGFLLSLSMRLFGNILAGSIMMSVIYQLLAAISAKVPVIGGFNFLGVLICPALHAYFDLFSGFMQTFIFSTLSISFIGKELPKLEESK